MKPIVQISLDLTSIDEALRTAELALAAGVDWLEAGTPLIIAAGQAGVRALRAAFPQTPIVADLKIMDGGYLEAEMMAQAGATHVVVMGQAQPETVELVVRAGRDFGLHVMGDNLGMPCHVRGAQRLAELGCHSVIHHIAYDVRTLRRERGEPIPSPLEELRQVVAAVDIPVQAVGGLSLADAIATPQYGAALVVIGAPLVIDPHAFRSNPDNLGGILREICERVHAQDVHGSTAI